MELNAPTHWLLVRICYMLPYRFVLVLESYLLSFSFNRLMSTLMSTMTKITSIVTWSMSCNDSWTKLRVSEESVFNESVKLSY